jgi:hypothetical protein
MEQDFSKAKVGQKLWHSFYSEVEVQWVALKTVCFIATNPIDWDNTEAVNGPRPMSENISGVNKYGVQVLFWSKPEIIVPPPPKEKVKKTLYVRVSTKIDRDEYPPRHFTSNAYETPEQAKSFMYAPTYQTVPIEIEVEAE